MIGDSSELFSNLSFAVSPPVLKTIIARKGAKIGSTFCLSLSIQSRALSLSFPSRVSNFHLPHRSVFRALRSIPQTAEIHTNYSYLAHTLTLSLFLSRSGGIASCPTRYALTHTRSFVRTGSSLCSAHSLAVHLHSQIDAPVRAHHDVYVQANLHTRRSADTDTAAYTSSHTQKVRDSDVRKRAFD